MSACHKRFHERARVRHRQCGYGEQSLGKLLSDAPRHGGAPVVTNKMHPLHTTCVDKRSDVLRKLGNAVVPAARRPGARGITTLARSQTTVALRGQPRNDRLPHRVLFREAMQQHNYRTVGRPGINDIENELTAAELFHRLSVRHQLDTRT